MQELILREVQAKAVEILVYIDNICRSNNLHYTLFYGTLIGVERHKGFISWDNDIDTAMPRPDYELLIKILKNDPNYQLLFSEIWKHFRYPFAKLVDPNTVAHSKQYFGGEDKDLGVFVDIFPIDGIPDTQKERNELRKIAEQCRLNLTDTLGLSYARSFRLSKALIKLIIRYPNHFRVKKVGDNQYWRDLYQTEAKKIPFGTTKHCGYLEWIHIDWGVSPNEWFLEYEGAESKGHKFMAVKNRKQFLTLHYGDYMEMSPVEERITHHPYDFYQK